MAIDGGNLVYFLLLVSICNWSLVNADNDNSTGQPFHLILAIKSNDPIPTVGSKLTLIYNLTNKFINPTSTSNVTLYGSISGMQNRLPSSYSYAESPTDNYTTLASQTFYDGAVVEFLNAKFDIQFEADFTVDNNVKQRRYIYFTVSANYTDDDGNMKTISNTTSIRMAGITIQNPITYPTLNWPATLLNNLTEGETLKVVVPIQLPRGRNHIIFNIDAIGINPNNVPALSLTQFYAPPKPSVTYHLSSNVNKQSLTLTGLSNSLDYSTSTTSFFINMGDVEFSPNANSTMTTVDLEFLFLHTSPYNAIPVPRERCNLWFRPTYNNIDRATFDQSIILDLVRPILKVWKEAKAEETNLKAYVNFKIIVSHKISSTALAYNVTIFDTLDTSVSPGFIPQIPTTYFSVIQRGRFLITNISIPVLNFGMNYTVSYRALIQSTPQSAPTNFTSDTKVEFNTLPSSIPIPYSSTTSNHNSASTSANTAKNRGCISLDYYTRTIYNNTQSILAGVFGVIGGIFIVVFMGFGYVYTDHKNYDNIIIRKKNRVSPTTSSFAHDNYHDTTSGGGVRNLMPTIFNRSPIRPQDSAKPVPTLYQMKSISPVESISTILGIHSEKEAKLELDILDITISLQFDAEMEQQYEELLVGSFTELIDDIERNGEIRPEDKKKISKDFHESLDKVSGDLYRNSIKDMNSIIEDLNLKNQARIKKLEEEQLRQSQDVRERVKSMAQKKQKNLLEMMEDQHRLEMKDLMHEITLENEELKENRRKESAVHKKLELKELLQITLNDLIAEYNINSDYADKLVRQHSENIRANEEIFNEEVARQRMVLEERLSARRAMIEELSNERKHTHENIRSMIDFQKEHMDELIQQQKISSSQAEKLIFKIDKEGDALFERFKRDQTNLCRSLQKRLTDEQKKQLKQMSQEHKKFRDEKFSHMQDDLKNGKITIDQLIRQKSSLVNDQREEMEIVVAKMDSKAIEEVQTSLRQLSLDIIKQMRANIDNFVKTLQKTVGSLEQSSGQIFNNYFNNLEQSQAAYEQESNRQREQLQERLKESRKRMKERRQKEIEAEESALQHEEKLVNQIIDNQLVLSQEDRKKLIQEHDKQAAKISNSLALNKLRQKRLIQEKLSNRKNRETEKIERKIRKETKKMQNKIEEEVEDVNEANAKADDVDFNMIQKEIGEKTKMLQLAEQFGEDVLEDIQEEMIQQREIALMEQEEKLGAMVASLQMEKARQLAVIESQQQTLAKLQLNMIDDLADRGVVDTSGSQEIFEKHNEGVDRLNKKLTQEREKQAKLLEERLSRMREQNINAIRREHDDTMKAAKAEGNKFAWHVRRAMLKAKFNEELEQYKQSMDVRIRQSLEDLNREFRLKEFKAVEEQQLRLIGSLVKLGKFEQEELMEVLKLLFPRKTSEELSNMLKVIYDSEYKNPKAKNKKKNGKTKLITSKFEKTKPLAERIRENREYKSHATNDSIFPEDDLPRPTSTKTKKEKKRAKSSKERKYSMDDTEPILNETNRSHKSSNKSRSNNDSNQNADVTVDDFFQ